MMAADENFRAVSIVFKDGFIVLNAEIGMRGQPWSGGDGRRRTEAEC
jgi:hypothetical protein